MSLRWPMAASIHRGKRLLLAMGVGTVFFSPYIVGIVHGPSWFSVLYVVFGVGLVGYAVLAKPYHPRLVRLGVVIVSCCLALTSIDLVSRPLLRHALYFRPNEMFLNRWPAMPSLGRYVKNVAYQGETFGDLAAISGNSEYRETRHVAFRTDTFGFRNDAKAYDKVIDVIILGDSFGVGVGTSQDKTWASILSERYGFRTYNLSSFGGPWQELMTLKIELARLATHEGTVVLWAIFTGNDLDEQYGGEIRPPQLNNAFRRGLVSLSTFRRRSPSRHVLLRRRIVSPNRVVVREFVNNKKMLFLGAYAYRRHSTIQDVLAHPNYGRLKKVFAGMAELTKSKRLAVGVVLIPTKAEVYSWVLDGERPWSADPRPSGVSVAVGEMSRANGFDFLDLKPLLIDEAKRVFEARGELLWWYDDTHWNETGHEVVSSIIHQRVLLPMKTE